MSIHSGKIDITSEEFAYAVNNNVLFNCHCGDPNCKRYMIIVGGRLFIADEDSNLTMNIVLSPELEQACEIFY